jgi:hypothetical protein
MHAIATVLSPNNLLTILFSDIPCLYPPNLSLANIQNFGQLHVREEKTGKIKC